MLQFSKYNQWNTYLQLLQNPLFLVGKDGEVVEFDPYLGQISDLVKIIIEHPDPKETRPFHVPMRQFTGSELRFLRPFIMMMKKREWIPFDKLSPKERQLLATMADYMLIEPLTHDIINWSTSVLVTNDTDQYANVIFETYSGKDLLRREQMMLEPLYQNYYNFYIPNKEALRGVIITEGKPIPEKKQCSLPVLPIWLSLSGGKRTTTIYYIQNGMCFKN